MLKKTITYTDYDGNQRTEDFFFNLSKAEVLEMEMGINGGMTKLIQRLVAEQDMERITKTFKDIILKAYGEKSLDGKYFEKSEEISRRFSQTGAYDELFLELLDPDKCALFINGILPQDALARANAMKEAPNPADLTVVKYGCGLNAASYDTGV